jgi:hypothetical protein
MRNKGSERIITKDGREVTAVYSYQRLPSEKKPSLVTFVAEAVKPDGNASAWFYEVACFGYLNKWELAREAEKVAARCAATERGEKDPPGTNERDITKTDLWRVWPHDEVPLTPNPRIPAKGHAAALDISGKGKR